MTVPALGAERPISDAILTEVGSSLAEVLGELSLP
jgi:hypothetical protein